MLPEQCQGCHHNLGEFGCEVLQLPETQRTRVGRCAHPTHNVSYKRDQEMSTDSIKISKRKVGVK